MIWHKAKDQLPVPSKINPAHSIPVLVYLGKYKQDEEFKFAIGFFWYKSENITNGYWELHGYAPANHVTHWTFLEKPKFK